VARRGGNAADRQLTLMDHVKELRNRGTIVALILLVGSCLAYSFSQQLLNVLKAPLGGGQELISLNVGGSFAVIMNISIAAGFVLATPFLIYHLYAFLRPMMPEKMRQNAAVMFFSSLLLLSGGIAFAYFLALPGALDFLLKFSDGAIIMDQLSIDAYLGFFIKYLLGLALIFQTPLVLMMVHWVTPLTPRGLMKSERWVIVISFIAAAIITPTSDPVNLLMVALPTVAVYQIGVIVIISGIYRQKRLARIALQRDRRREAAAVKRAIAERKKLNAGPSRLVAVAPTKQPIQAHSIQRPVQPKVAALQPVQQQMSTVVSRPPLSQKPMDIFLPETRKKAPDLAAVYRVESASMPRPAERTVQTYRTRKSIDGFARRQGLGNLAGQAVVQPTAVGVTKPPTTHLMQEMVPLEPSQRYNRLSVDGISNVLATS
jgi:sec-independent protein translocase protein TatC